MAWFLTGLRHEAIRLAKKHKRLQEHELLILNDLLSQDAEKALILSLVSGLSPPMAMIQYLVSTVVYITVSRRNIGTAPNSPFLIYR